MRKILPIILALLLVINLFGCAKAKETSTYDFEYKFKEEYSEIDGAIASVFLALVNGLIEIHSTVLDADNQEKDSEFNAYIEKTLGPLRDEVITSPKKYSEEEIEVLKHMMEIATVSGKLQIVKLEYNLDGKNEKMGLKRKNTSEYYEEQLENHKTFIEELLEKSKDFID